MTPPGPTQLLVVLLVVVLLFGAKKLPDLARSVGRSTRILKSELGGTPDDGAARSEDRALEEPPAGEPAARERVAEERTTGER